MGNAVSNTEKGILDPTSTVPKQVYGYLRHIEERFGRQKVIDIERFDLVTFIQEYSTERGTRSADRIRSPETIVRLRGGAGLPQNYHYQKV